MDHRERVDLLVRADGVLGRADIDFNGPNTTNDDALDLVRLQVLVQDLGRGPASARASDAAQAMEIAARLLRRAVEGKLTVPDVDRNELRALLGSVDAALAVLP